MVGKGGVSPAAGPCRPPAAWLPQHRTHPAAAAPRRCVRPRRSAGGQRAPAAPCLAPQAPHIPPPSPNGTPHPPTQPKWHLKASLTRPSPALCHPTDTPSPLPSPPSPNLDLMQSIPPFSHCTLQPLQFPRAPTQTHWHPSAPCPAHQHSKTPSLSPTTPHSTLESSTVTPRTQQPLTQSWHPPPPPPPRLQAPTQSLKRPCRYLEPPQGLALAEGALGPAWLQRQRRLRIRQRLLVSTQLLQAVRAVPQEPVGMGMSLWPVPPTPGPPSSPQAPLLTGAPGGSSLGQR